MCPTKVLTEREPMQQSMCDVQQFKYSSWFIETYPFLDEVITCTGSPGIVIHIKKGLPSA